RARRWSAVAAGFEGSSSVRLINRRRPAIIVHEAKNFGSGNDPNLEESHSGRRQILSGRAGQPSHIRRPLGSAAFQELPQIQGQGARRTKAANGKNAERSNFAPRGKKIVSPIWPVSELRHPNRL